MQLLQNLLSNAIKYRKPDKHPRIRVAVSRLERDYLIRVEDNGIGIDPLYHRQIPGTGIGLAICQRVVERAGGRIWMESAKGSGARFCFTLRATDPA